MVTTPPNVNMPARTCGRLLVLCLLLSAASLHPVDAEERPSFGILYTVWMKPEQKSATVKMRISRRAEWVDQVQMSIDPKRHGGFLGSGKLQVAADKVTWEPPHEDAWMQFDVALESKRSNGRYDGYLTEDWALFRADDLVPPFRSSFKDLTQSQAKLQFHLPDGWSVETRYPRYQSGRFNVDDADRWVDRPTGWVIMGKIGTRREKIGNTRITVSAPVGQGVHRMDLVAFLRWTVPTLQSIFPRFPERLLLVSADDPMWRGALSGPNSLFVHADRPMISGNSTSTVVHELVHVAMRARGGDKADWIVEGLAEYYSLEVLRRSGTISQKRFEQAHADLADWGAEVPNLEVDRSYGPITAKAVGVLREIDQSIRSDSAGTHSLDDVVRALAADDAPITRARFNELVVRASNAEL